MSRLGVKIHIMQTVRNPEESLLACYSQIDDAMTLLKL